MLGIERRDSLTTRVDPRTSSLSLNACASVPESSGSSHRGVGRRAEASGQSGTSLPSASCSRQPCSRTKYSRSCVASAPSCASRKVRTRPACVTRTPTMRGAIGANESCWQLEPPPPPARQDGSGPPSGRKARTRRRLASCISAPRLDASMERATMWPTTPCRDTGARVSDACGQTPNYVGTVGRAVSHLLHCEPGRDCAVVKPRQ
eukprot:SAG11_NODE_1255_length_5375_cov_2.966641_3_plen_206_part_00